MTERELIAVRELNEEMKRGQWRLQLLRDALAQVVPIRDGLPRSKRTTSKIEEITAQIMELERELEEQRLRKEEKQAELTSAICAAGLSVPEMQVLIRRYVWCMTWQAICEDLKRSDNGIFYLHRTAIKKFKVAPQ